MPGARCTHSLACNNKQAYERSHHRFTGITRHFLHNGFNGLLRALPGVPGLLATVIRELLRELDTSVGVTGPHGFAVRNLLHSSKKPTASTASRPTFATLANAPLVGTGRRIKTADLGVR